MDENHEVRISDVTLQRLTNLEAGSSGKLIIVESTTIGIVVIGFITNNDNVNAELHTPGGLNFDGNFTVSEESDLKSNLIILVHPTTKDIKATKITDDGKEIASKVSSITETELAKSLLILRCRITIPFNSGYDPVQISSQCDHIRRIVGKDVKIVELDKEVSLNPSLGDKTYKSLKDMAVLNCSPMLRMDSFKTEFPNCFRITINEASGKHCRFHMSVDSLTYIARNESSTDITSKVLESLQKYVSLCEKSLLSSMENGEDLSVPETFHFLLGAGHFVSAVYPKNKLDSDLGDLRKKLHEAFSLPMDRPLLMRGNAHPFTAKKEDGKELRNPHESVGVSGVAGGEPVLLQGIYSYYHYCQQGMDDNGWGCAYRSLQTLASWFRFQGYTNKEVPTIKEIQECLVRIGDKPSSFVGSRQWIGSTEVGFCLDTLLGISCRIVSVSSGEEMSMKGGELSHHFRTQGTPVMIGGGNLAHTILGVDYNKKTGDIKFLILDPHYTGGEDITTIVSKGWCGWKPLSFWKKGSFYNMCMPLRPKFI